MPLSTMIIAPQLPSQACEKKGGEVLRGGGCQQGNVGNEFSAEVVDSYTGMGGMPDAPAVALAAHRQTDL